MRYPKQEKALAGIRLVNIPGFLHQSGKIRPLLWHTEPQYKYVTECEFLRGFPAVRNSADKGKERCSNCLPLPQTLLLCIDIGAAQIPACCLISSFVNSVNPTHRRPAVAMNYRRLGAGSVIR